LAEVVDPEGRYGFELILDAPRRAWENRVIETGNWEREYHDALRATERAPYPDLQGIDFDFHSTAEMRRRFPRLAGMYLQGPAGQ
jgi:hypothetical protein